MKYKKANFVFHMALYLICWGAFHYIDKAEPFAFFVIFMDNLINYFSSTTNYDAYKRVLNINREYSKTLDGVIAEYNKIRDMNNRLNECNIALRGGK